MSVAHNAEDDRAALFMRWAGQACRTGLEIALRDPGEKPPNPAPSKLTTHLSSMLKKILCGLAVILLILVVVVAMQPADFRISRSAVIAAPPAAVFEQINDYHKWNDWSPWAKLDPNAKNSFDGPTSGVGSKFAWAGNNEVGEGSMRITESKPNERVVMDLVFLKPFAATNTTEFTLKPEGSGTAVTWSMSGKNGFMGKAVGLFMNCDKMVGGKFEQGFENLKSIVAKP